MNNKTIAITKLEEIKKLLYYDGKMFIFSPLLRKRLITGYYRFEDVELAQKGKIKEYEIKLNNERVY